jgi:glycosyltransferase involved in cell wall biosynthesis
VRLLGHLPEEDLRALYHGARAFAYISQYEGFGYPPLEAMACGCPSLTSDGGSLAEVVGDAALVVSVDDEAALVEGLRRLMTDMELRARLRAAGPEQASRYRWDVAAAVVEHAYLRARSV